MADTQTSMHVECDVLVVGSGAGGLAAAVTARKHGLDTLIVEKARYFGGTTARSGGVLWVPCNPVSVRAGVVDDTIEAARTYLRHETGNFFDPERVDAFLENGPRMVEFFERETSVQFEAAAGFPDYHPDAPGACYGGRSIMSAPFNGRELGTHLKDLSPPLSEITFVGMMINSSREVQQFFNVTRSFSAALYVTKRLVRHAIELVRSGRATGLANGNALAARLAKSVFDLGVPLWLSSPVVQLVTDEDGVRGAVVDRPEGAVTVTARRGVVLACGGFPQDKLRRKLLFPHERDCPTHLSPAPQGNVGDGIALAVAAGGRTQDDLPSPAAWIPVSRVPYRRGPHGVFPHLIDRYKPGIVAVTSDGKRFVNESDSYHDFGKALLKAGSDKQDFAAWLICDHKAIRRYGLGFAKPFPLPLYPHFRSGYLQRGRTLEELAIAVGIDAAALRKTIDAYNVGAREGVDEEFGRGTTAYNRYLGDPDSKPNPCVAPVDQAPFYAVRVVLGDLGTFAGVKTDRHARVVDANGKAITGLYAVGNDMVSVMGGNYPGGGITLGPAMTFGYVAGRHLAGLS